MAVSAVKSLPRTKFEWTVGLSVACIAVAVALASLFWGRAIPAAIAIAAGGVFIAMLRYLEIASFLTGVVLVANLGAFIPGSTTGFFAAVLLILLVRKAMSFDTNWRIGAIVLASCLFITYYQVTGLWVDQTTFYSWKLVERVILAIIVVSELVSTPRHYITLFVGCAVGMTFTSISAMRTATEFYMSGVADQIAGQVNSIESSRFFGHWPDPNIMAMTLTTFLGGVFALWRSRVHIMIRTVALIAVVTSVAAVIISLSRAGLLTCLTILLLMTAVERRRLTILAVVSSILVIMLTFLPIDLYGRVSSLLSGTDASGSERLALSMSGWKFFWSNPIFGAGMGSFENSVVYLLPHLPHGVFAHNTLVDIAVDGGLVAVALMVGCLFFAFKGLTWNDWRPDPNDTFAMLNVGLRSGLIATIVSMLTMSSVTYVPFWVYFIVCAMFAVTCRRNGIVTAVATA